MNLRLNLIYVVYYQRKLESNLIYIYICIIWIWIYVDIITYIYIHNVGPCSCVCWFIKSMNTIVIGTINHS